MLGLNQGHFCWDVDLFCTVDMMDSWGGGEGELPALLLPASLRTRSLITAGVCGINRRGERL